MAKDGVIRIDNAVGADTCDRLRNHILRQQQFADTTTSKNIESSEAYYGVENRRKNQCDLLHSLVPNEEDKEHDCNVIF